MTMTVVIGEKCEENQSKKMTSVTMKIIVILMKKENEEILRSVWKAMTLCV